MQVNCSKQGFTDGYGTVPSDFEGWTLGNLVIGGPLGVGIDAVTGAINEYPHSYPIPMSPVGIQPTAPVSYTPISPSS